MGRGTWKNSEPTSEGRGEGANSIEVGGIPEKRHATCQFKIAACCYAPMARKSFARSIKRITLLERQNENMRITTFTLSNEQ